MGRDVGRFWILYQTSVHNPKNNDFLLRLLVILRSTQYMYRSVAVGQIWYEHYLPYMLDTETIIVHRSKDLCGPSPLNPKVPGPP